MIKDHFDSNAGSMPDSQPSGGGCRAHWMLTAWQIRQYRNAIDENKWYMGERLGRHVAWEEAEYDFLNHEYYGCAPKWRMKYCIQLCHHFADCKLGQRFAAQ